MHYKALSAAACLLVAGSAYSQTATLPIYEGFDGVGSTTNYQGPTTTPLTIDGLTGWTYEGTGGARLNFRQDFTPHNTPLRRMATMDNPGGESFNQLFVSFDASGHTAATEKLILSFDWYDHGDEGDSADRVYVRGSDTDTWIEIYDFAANSNNGAWTTVRDIDVSAALTANTQEFSATTQIRFRQNDNFPVNTDGISIEDVSIEFTNQPTASPEPNTLIANMVDYIDIAIVNETEVEYKVSLLNPADAGAVVATAVNFTMDTFSTETVLVAGSVLTSQGTVTTGNTGGDTTVVVDLGDINDGASATIYFRATVTVDDSLNFTNQATVSATGIAPFLTHDPHLPGTRTPTASTIQPVAQPITNFQIDSATPRYSDSATVSATGGASGNTVTFASTTPWSCIITNDTTVSMLIPGDCTLTANQAGTAIYADAEEETLTFTIQKDVQSISNAYASNTDLIPGSTTSLFATGGSSGNPVVFASTSPAVCTVAGNTATMVTAGTCQLTADQAGNAFYEAATQATLDLTVKATQTISNFAASDATPYMGETFTLSATGGASGNMVVFASSTPTVCTVAGNIVTAMAVGNCELTANQAGNNSFQAAAEASLSLVVKAQQVIAGFIASNNTPSIGETATLFATGGASGNPILFGSATTAICTVNGNIATMIAEGTCQLTASQAGSTFFDAAVTVNLNLSVKQAQVITGFIADDNQPQPGDIINLLATGGDSGNTVVFASTTPAVCTVSGSSVTLVTAGTCILTANQAGNSNYQAAAEVTLAIAARTPQTISGFTASNMEPYTGREVTLEATGGASGNPVVFSSNTPSICTVSGNTATMEAEGTCELAANQAGSNTFEAAPAVTIELEVTKKPKGSSGGHMGFIALMMLVLLQGYRVRYKR